MILNFTLWSWLISLISISLFYPLSIPIRSAIHFRFWSLVFLLPALVAVLHTLSLLYINQSIIIKPLSFNMVPIDFGLKLDLFDTLVLISALLFVTSLTFFFPTKKIAENLSVTAMSVLMIGLIAVVVDQFLKMALFSFGSIVFVFMVINASDDRFTIKSITSDFFLQRVSDIIAFFGLLIILVQKFTHINQDTVLEKAVAEQVPLILYFLAITIKVLSTIYRVGYSQIRVENQFTGIILRKIYQGVGSQIIFSQFYSAFIVNYYIDLVFILTGIFILACAALSIAIMKNISYFQRSLDILIALAFFSNLVRNEMATLVFICCLLLCGPLFYLPSSATLSNFSASAPSVSKNPFAPMRGLYFSTRFLSNFFSFVYTSIILYRIPKIALGITQIPLRFFHNGNIQRSLFFVVIIVISYFFWWSHR